MRPTVSRITAAAIGLAAALYLAYAGKTWYRYGRIERPAGQDEDPLLDRFMPAYDVVERHDVRIVAPAEITLAAAANIDLRESAIIRGIFKGRELILGSDPGEKARPHALLSEMKALGWGVLAEIEGREIVVGAVTQPWMANVKFRALSPEEFAAFKEPGYAKIVWTLRADPIGPFASVASTETRVKTTDAIARAKFRRYWSFVSPGVVIIRWIALGLAKKQAELTALRSMSAYSPSRR